MFVTTNVQAHGWSCSGLTEQTFTSILTVIGNNINVSMMALIEWSIVIYESLWHQQVNNINKPSLLR